MPRQSLRLVYPRAFVAGLLFSSSAFAASPIPGMTETQTVALIGGVLAIIFCAVGGYFIYAGVKSRRLAKESELWPTTAEGSSRRR